MPFTFDQQVSLISWLENLQEAGLNLGEVIEGLTDGTLTKPVAETETNSETVNANIS